MYYVRCNTRSSGASARGTPRQALDYITDAHDAERDPSYSHAELAYIARLDPGWKTDLEGGRVPLVGLGALAGSRDPAVLATEFEQGCQPYHDRRGTTGYLSYTFTMPKELSLVAEGQVRSRQAIYAALQSSLDTAFAGKEYKAVTAIHTRNEAGEVHYHAHVLIGKFARDITTGRIFSLNSRSGGNTGKLRLKALKQAWKDSLDAELKQRLGLTVMQSSPYARPALTLADGTYVPALNRESRRVLDKHLCFRISESTVGGATKTRNFRWTHFDPTIYELACSRRAGGWSATTFCDLFPELAGRLKTYESRVATLKRIGYLTNDGRVTDAFTLHYRVHKGDHPELQRLRADLHKLARQGKKSQSGGGGGHAPPDDPAPVIPSPGSSDQTSPEPSSVGDTEVDLWLVLHRHQRLLRRLERLGVSPAAFKKILQEARRSRPTPETLRHLRAQARQQAERATVQPKAPRSTNIIRAYCGVYKAQAVSFFVLSKGLLTLRLGEHAAIAEKMRRRARLDYQLAKERRLGVIARRLRPLFMIGRIVMPHEVNRLELALRRCNQLAARENAEAIYRQQRARAYRNSRDALIARLRADARKEAFKSNPQLARQQENLEQQVDRLSSPIPSASSETRAIAHLRAGLEVLRVHRPQDHARLLPWRDRESELIAALLARAKERRPFSRDHEAALLAGRIGQLLHKERASTPATVVPPALEDLAGDINLANARLRAAGAPAPFSAEALRALPVAAIAKAVHTFRDTGLLTEGPAWTLRVASVLPVAERVHKQLSTDLDSEKEAER